MMAMQQLDARLDQAANSELMTRQSQLKKEQTGTGMRGDKIRTYRFQDNVTVDHQSEKKAQTSTVMSGHFDKLWA